MNGSSVTIASVPAEQWLSSRQLAYLSSAAIETIHATVTMKHKKRDREREGEKEEGIKREKNRLEFIA